MLFPPLLWRRILSNREVNLSTVTWEVGDRFRVQGQEEGLATGHVSPIQCGGDVQSKRFL